MVKVYNPSSVVDLSNCFLWQYNNSKNVNKLLNNKQDFYNSNITKFWDNWLADIFNINTAKTFGLNLWGSMLGVARPSFENEEGALIYYTDDQYRLLIKARLMYMNSNGSVHDINAYLSYLFPGKPLYILDRLDMSIDIIFAFQPTIEESAVIKNDDFIPRPAGVLINVNIVPSDEVFGFNGSDLGTFDTATFFS